MLGEGSALGSALSRGAAALEPAAGGNDARSGGDGVGGCTGGAVAGSVGPPAAVGAPGRPGPASIIDTPVTVANPRRNAATVTVCPRVATAAREGLGESSSADPSVAYEFDPGGGSETRGGVLAGGAAETSCDAGVGGAPGRAVAAASPASAASAFVSPTRARSFAATTARSMESRRRWARCARCSVEKAETSALVVGICATTIARSIASRSSAAVEYRLAASWASALRATAAMAG